MKGTKFVGNVKLTSQGQVTVPQEARKQLGIAQNAEVFWYLFDDALVLVKDLVAVEDLPLMKKSGRGRE
ncbi:AbrB/MazE/SpoVT family DNA-binding domain-containing protein [Candidatus Woesearchaeota archaeon]|nr:AbrB/MazE/SpoVT family DNA-binding domain-containing protein [Candidatus Woesearchaeota archaeon]